MHICPHCGAGNADNSTFCSLCLGKFGAASANLGPAVTPASPAPTAPAAPPQQQPQEYVSPSDYHALTREMQQQSEANPGYRDSAYYGAAMQHPDAISAARVPSYMHRRSTLDIIILVLMYSFIMYLALFAVRLVVGMFLLGAAFGGSEAGFSFGIAMLFLGDALIFISAGYVISAKAMERGRGWIYGLACVAAIIFFWQALVGFVLSLLMTGDVYVPVFTLVGMMFALFLDLPMGALGGWIAEKRYIG